ncbi:four helix bundle protein [Pedobacter xixiisoli]|uniref:Four helix bundle protein n=1 Tax=Pedobacter xixiisoli TaxID=1476464 RepID=A0A285ZYA1_9SPHI|nr:four helix bundle protein [Pedobacter xixiisoli]SOD14619.1 four helix bundle protein [Pedobacter xixiisoli]
MAIKCFEDVIAWRKAQDIAIVIYKEFKNNKDWDFKSQICRAAVSISNNIAEGFDRGTKPEFRRFLYIALASNSEVRSMLHLALRLGYINEAIFKKIVIQSEEVAKIISGLIKSLIPKS